MVADCDREFNGPEFTFIAPEEAQLVRKTLCEDRDCDVVLRERYTVARCINVDSDEELSAPGQHCEALLRQADDQLRDCDDGSRVITDIDTATLAHNELHDETFSVLYEPPSDSVLDGAFLLYFSQTRVTQERSAPKML